MTRPEIELSSPRSLANTLPIFPIGRSKIYELFNDITRFICKYCIVIIIIFLMLYGTMFSKLALKTDLRIYSDAFLYRAPILWLSGKLSGTYCINIVISLDTLQSDWISEACLQDFNANHFLLILDAEFHRLLLSLVRVWRREFLPDPNKSNIT